MADAKKLEVFAKLTPLDIRGKAVKRTMRGFIGADVNASLEELAEELKCLFGENIALAKHCEAMEEKLGRYRQLEQTLEARWSLPSAAPRSSQERPTRKLSL